MWPILQRELREQARQPANYWLRLIGAVLLLVLFWFAWRSQFGQQMTNGRGFFAGLNRLLFMTIWLIGPVLTADCLSREKREGTLGLLFLTPLRARDVVLGKAFVNALRAFSVLLAAVPVLVVPVLLGGVGWPDAVRMLLLHFAALGMALTAGLLASSVTTSWLRARLLAFVLAVGAAGVFALLYVGVLSVVVRLTSARAAQMMSLAEMMQRNLETLFFRAGIIIRNPSYFWRDFGLGIGWGAVPVTAILTGLALLLVVCAIWVATVAVRRTWQAEPLSPNWARRLRFFTDLRVSRSWWKARMAGRLERNPLWWRHSSTWTARLTMWGWLGVTMILLTAAFTGFGVRGTQAMWLIETLLLLGMAFSAAASFRQERESGALELLLVTPLEPARMIRGRLLALAVQFGPSALLVFGLPLVLQLVGWRAPIEHSLRLLVWLPVTAMFGVALSLSRFSFLTAFALTAVLHHVPVLAKVLAVAAVAWAGRELPDGDPLRAALELALGLVSVVVAGIVLHRSWQHAVACLAERRFAACPARKPAAT
jgi:ABC-type transport system involved in multi-copper enzyme maturation permease subunit